jgi:ATP-dependent Clp protease protease subunit
MRIRTEVSNSINYRKEDLFDMPTVINVGDFTARTFEIFKAKFNRAESNPDQPVIPIVIDSPGGQIYSLLGMLSLIDTCEKPVATIGMCKAMSCGAVLLSSGTPGYRFSDPNCTIMVHDASAGTIGKVEDMKVSVENSERLKKDLYNRLALNCNQDKRFFFNKIKDRGNTNWYLTPKQAKKLGLIDHICIPNMEVKVSVEMEFNY